MSIIIKHWIFYIGVLIFFSVCALVVMRSGKMPSTPDSVETLYFEENPALSLNKDPLNEIDSENSFLERVSLKPVELVTSFELDEQALLQQEAAIKTIIERYDNYLSDVNERRLLEQELLEITRDYKKQILAKVKKESLTSDMTLED